MRQEGVSDISKPRYKLRVCRQSLNSVPEGLDTITQPIMAAPSMAMDRYFKGRDAEEPAVKAIADFFNAPLVKDIPRGMLKVQTPGAQVNTAPFRARKFLPDATLEAYIP